MQGRGKRGGARIIYYYVDRHRRVYLVAAYAKNQKANLSAAEKADLRALARVIEGEEGE